MFEYKGVKIQWLGHDSFSLVGNVKIIIDPYKITKQEKADLILVSHNHFDHLSVDDLKNVSTGNTIIVAATECIDLLKGFAFKEKIGISPGQEKTILGIKIKSIPAYNLDKINPDTKKPFHPKEDNKIGFLFELNGITIYHTGDTDLIPDMSDLKPDIALVPVSGTYVMTAQEAAKAIEKIKPKIAIPMHYGVIVGSEKDAHDFKQLVKSCEVQILTKE
ncbi:Zn-dependent hydrolase of the beta-lactamase fold protein [Nitrosotalea devaniterrae]|uniref:Zn-dependent hydrolase of the beta-lactamase fold protein n=1 Tax=Nitrosotalea devaniterrae TaxID=1078905 RepID=A0A128A0L6_9ARCH|nr:Zn-dependent hydrolase of the beta-lactamase fold protein [Candidatus Nitrosotalea devanaterra]